jgi:hypothetical protein
MKRPVFKILCNLEIANRIYCRYAWNILELPKKVLISKVYPVVRLYLPNSVFSVMMNKCPLNT